MQEFRHRNPPPAPFSAQGNYTVRITVASILRRAVLPVYAIVLRQMLRWKFQLTHTIWPHDITLIIEFKFVEFVFVEFLVDYAS